MVSIKQPCYCWKFLLQIYPPMIHSASGHCTGAISTRIYLIQFIWPGSTTRELESSTYSYPQRSYILKTIDFRNCPEFAYLQKFYDCISTVEGSHFQYELYRYLLFTIVEPSYDSVYPLMYLSIGKTIPLCSSLILPQPLVSLIFVSMFVFHVFYVSAVLRFVCLFYEQVILGFISILFNFF